jgi:hypothetical protein
MFDRTGPERDLSHSFHLLGTTDPGLAQRQKLSQPHGECFPLHGRQSIVNAPDDFVGFVTSVFQLSMKAHYTYRLLA